MVKPISMDDGSRTASPMPSDYSRRRILMLLAGSAALASCAGSPPARDAAPEQRPSSDQFLALVKRGDSAGVSAMLDRDARLARATDTAGRSAFVWAHVSGFPAIAALLTARGLELDLVESVLAEDWPRVEALAAANPAQIGAAHPIGGTPLFASALCGGGEQFRLRSLGCDSDARPTGGRGVTPARAAMDCVDPIGAWLAAMDILSNGGHVNAPQAGGDSVLHGAVGAKDARLVRLALRKGADVDARDERGRSARDLALELGWQAGAELLRDHASIPRDHRASQFAFNQSRERFLLQIIEDVPAKVQSQITGLSHFNRERVAELLRESPRLIHAISSDAELAIEACGHTGVREIIQLHLDHGAPLSLPNAISLGDLDHARWLLDLDPRLIHERGPHDFPVMWYPAIGKGSVAAAELLLERGADLEQESCGETALHWAAMRDHSELIRYLVSRGADLQAVGYRQERSGLTPLGLAIAKKRDGAAATLRELGARG